MSDLKVRPPATTHSKVPPLHELLSTCGAFAPEEVGGQADEKEKDGGLEIHKFGRVEESEIDSIANNDRGDENEEYGRPRIAGNTIGNWAVRRGATNGKNGGGAQTVENPADKNYAFYQFAESAQLTSTHQNCRPYAQSNDGRCGSLKPRMHFREFHEKEFVFGHGVENTRGSENYAIGGAEGGNQNGERHDFAGPCAEDGGDRGGGDGVAHGHFRRAESEEVSNNGDEIETDENQRAH